jgi:hypothetical protein
MSARLVLAKLANRGSAICSGVGVAILGPLTVGGKLMHDDGPSQPSKYRKTGED